MSCVEVSLFQDVRNTSRVCLFEAVQSVSCALRCPHSRVSGVPDLVLCQLRPPKAVGQELHGLRESEGEDRERVDHHISRPLTVVHAPILLQLMKQRLST